MDSNRINADPSKVGSCPSPAPWYWCGGIESEGANATFINNIVYGMPAPRSIAFFYAEGEVAFGDITVANNHFDGGPGTGLSIAMGCRTSQGTNAKVGTIHNNNLFGGSAPQRFAFYEDDQQNGKTCEPLSYLNNNLFFYATGANATHTAHRRWTGAGAQKLLATVDDVNLNLGFADNNFNDDCLLDAGFHLGSGSPCIDAGTPTSAPASDFDNERRDDGKPDVGVDEAR